MFYDNGIKSEYDMMEYAENNTSLVNNISVSYKGSGRSKYIKLGIQSSMDQELPTLMEEVEQIQEQYYLCEGVFSNLKNRAKRFLTSIKKAVMKFINKVIMRVIGNLKTLAQKGVSSLMEALGLEFSANVTMSSPKW